MTPPLPMATAGRLKDDKPPGLPVRKSRLRPAPFPWMFSHRLRAHGTSSHLLLHWLWTRVARDKRAVTLTTKHSVAFPPEELLLFRKFILCYTAGVKPPAWESGTGNRFARSFPGEWGAKARAGSARRMEMGAGVGGLGGGANGRSGAPP